MNNIIQLEQHLDEAVKVKKRIQSTGTEGLDFDSRISFEMNQMYVKNSEIFKNKSINNDGFMILKYRSNQIKYN